MLQALCCSRGGAVAAGAAQQPRQYPPLSFPCVPALLTSRLLRQQLVFHPLANLFSLLITRVESHNIGRTARLPQRRHVLASTSRSAESAITQPQPRNTLNLCMPLISICVMGQMKRAVRCMSAGFVLRVEQRVLFELHFDQILRTGK